MVDRRIKGGKGMQWREGIINGEAMSPRNMEGWKE